MQTQMLKTKESGKIRNIVMETGRAYRIVSLRHRLPKDQGREGVLVDIVPVSPKRPCDMVAKVRFTDDGKLGRAKFADLLPVGELYDGEYTEDDPTHRPEDYGWEDLDLPEAVLLDMVERAKAGRRLTAEQYEALDREQRGFFPASSLICFPSNSKKITREQSQAVVGGPERAELIGRWLPLEVMSASLKQSLNEGKTHWQNKHGTETPIVEMLATVEPMLRRASADLAEFDREHRQGGKAMVGKS